MLNERLAETTIPAHRLPNDFRRSTKTTEEEENSLVRQLELNSNYLDEKSAE